MQCKSGGIFYDCAAVENAGQLLKENSKDHWDRVSPME